jgi:hypothetical protein
MPNDLLSSRRSGVGGVRTRSRRSQNESRKSFLILPWHVNVGDDVLVTAQFGLFTVIFEEYSLVSHAHVGEDIDKSWNVEDIGHSDRIRGFADCRTKYPCSNTFDVCVDGGNTWAGGSSGISQLRASWSWEML